MDVGWWEARLWGRGSWLVGLLVLILSCNLAKNKEEEERLRYQQKGNESTLDLGVRTGLELTLF